MTNQLAEAAKKSKELPQKPSNEELLNLYALYKQATEGDNSGSRPTGFDFKAIAKHDAWDAIKGMDKSEAENKYIALVDDLHKKYA